MGMKQKIMIVDDAEINRQILMGFLGINMNMCRQKMAVRQSICCNMILR